MKLLGTNIVSESESSSSRFVAKIVFPPNNAEVQLYWYWFENDFWTRSNHRPSLHLSYFIAARIPLWLCWHDNLIEKTLTLLIKSKKIFLTIISVKPNFWILLTIKDTSDRQNGIFPTIKDISDHQRYFRPFTEKKFATSIGWYCMIVFLSSNLKSNFFDKYVHEVEVCNFHYLFLLMESQLESFSFSFLELLKAIP